MKIIIQSFISLLSMTMFSTYTAYADVNLNENIYKNCKVDNNGIMYGCQTREEPIANILDFPTRPDIKLHDIFNYSYPCQDNFTTDIEIVSRDGSALGKFKYLGGTFENDASGTLSVKDFDPSITPRAKYDKNCQLSITSLSQDLSVSAIASLQKDVCTMDVLNNNIAQTGIVLSLAQSLSNNVGSLTIPQLNAQLNLLVINLQSLRNQTSDPGIQASIDSMIGNSTTVGSIDYILQNDSVWGAGSRQLITNMNLLYTNMQTILTNMNGKSYDAVMSIYNGDKDVLGNPALKSSVNLESNLMFEYSILQGQDTNKFVKPSC